jgi:hypothetical protein
MRELDEGKTFIVTETAYPSVNSAPCDVIVLSRPRWRLLCSRPPQRSITTVCAQIWTASQVKTRLLVAERPRPQRGMLDPSVVIDLEVPCWCDVVG